MRHPTIHLNGTGRATLSREYGEVVEKLRAALTALDELTVNGRDYYPQGPDAVQQAIEEHRARYRQVQAVYDDMWAIYERLENS
jgi:hypothetical protein